jgi:hypothetical protein
MNAVGRSFSDNPWRKVNPLGSPGACSVSAPALPWWLGVGCWSTPNACGAQGWGTYSCAGACSGVTPANPPWLGVGCSATNVCGATNWGIYNCAGACSASAPTPPAGYGNACTSPANACGQTATGTIGCAGVCTAVTPTLPPGYGNACTSPANACGMTTTGTIGCAGVCTAVTPANSLCDLAVCKNSCSSEVNRTTNFSVDSGPPATTLRACFYRAGTPVCKGGIDVTASATWTETNAPRDTIYFSPIGVLNARYVDGNEVFNVSYLGVTKSPQVTVSCTANTCDMAAAKAVRDTYCPEVIQDTGIASGCNGETLICPGTRKCNYNWREVAP